MFKIVLTKEKGSEMVCAVPSSWESNGVLSWPRVGRQTQLERLRSDAKSFPDGQWRKMKCKIKVDGIRSFEEALKLEELYASFQATEDEER